MYEANIRAEYPGSFGNTPSRLMSAASEYIRKRHGVDGRLACNGTRFEFYTADSSIDIVLTEEDPREVHNLRTALTPLDVICATTTRTKSRLVPKDAKLTDILLRLSREDGYNLHRLVVSPYEDVIVDAAIGYRSNGLYIASVSLRAHVPAKDGFVEEVMHSFKPKDTFFYDENDIAAFFVHWPDNWVFIANSSFDTDLDVPTLDVHLPFEPGTKSIGLTNMRREVAKWVGREVDKRECVGVISDSSGRLEMTKEEGLVFFEVGYKSRSPMVELYDRDIDAINGIFDALPTSNTPWEILSYPEKEAPRISHISNFPLTVKLRDRIMSG